MKNVWPVLRGRKNLRVQASRGGKTMKAGILFRLGSFWIGAHWSSYNQRLCINLIPCVTLWIALSGGNVPNINRLKSSGIVLTISPLHTLFQAGGKSFSPTLFFL